MTQDDIIRMAREAGFDVDEGLFPFEATEDKYIGTSYNLERFAALVAAHEAEKWKAENKRDYENWKMAAEKAAECEREACAKACENIEPSWKQNSVNCAAAIRARSEK